MFNRNNIPFTSRSNPPPPDPRRGNGYDAVISEGDRNPSRGGGYGAPPPPQRGPAPGARRPVNDGSTWTLRSEKSPNTQYTYGNLVAVSTADFPPSAFGQEFYVLINDLYVLSARPLDSFPPGYIGFAERQRMWARIAVTDSVRVQIYDPFRQERKAYLGSADVEVGFAGKARTDEPYDQNELANAVIEKFKNQILAPGQKVLMDHRGIPLSLSIKTVELVDLMSEKQPQQSAEGVATDPTARGILTPHTAFNFYKDAKSGLNLKASDRRPAANSIIRPDFKFEDMGIGGLDSEFSTIFRRAFASRIFPPGLINKLGIQHVKGILLYGVPGTGKTLIARQIGKMLNAREPKIINGPEVLNKYVGQSEENIRKMFADAEKEYKEKGDESALHIIIFDELDAVCKQRGSGAGGGTGVGDSVVNQLLSKLDGVDQLNNILLIGMTNRKDMIDDALLRPGRLEVHMEIGLPDEKGRAQILKIHTQKMRENNVMEPDVDLVELAQLTKNYSGAEISGLVKAATSFAFNRHVKPDTIAGIKDDVANLKVRRDDFLNALEEVKPAFGVAEEQLGDCIQQGIIHFSDRIKDILNEGNLFVKQVGEEGGTPLFSVLFHGPPASGKTALAARIAMDSGYPFIRLISPEDMVGFTESAKIQHITKIFSDAYKSRTSIVVVDNIERLIDWVPIGARFSNAVLQTLMVFMRKAPANGRRLLILATTTERRLLKDLDMYSSFNSDIEVPTVNTYDELRYILEGLETFTPQEIEGILGGIYSIDDDKKIGVGIKKILLGIETAKQDIDKAGRFVNVINRLIDQDRGPAFS
ncbi:vesicular fusion ATPase, putative [Talaromyces stipitatus ATCC 10500]|uniref:Vesicular-fusion protein SEC18 n=1 Tax=Talaromyces stipitatus (strain ATCC 10500 / CBS 375.48 / QM 6759 / NRRL 1006) TaxID=441959 RepID=B8MAR9_TALSN|nr:vesicular fusion ATPase, putative [Talaromyces stipitatus ATCC 10500]EED17759.1 vesicular fusion ATPase, putative [Talaromyces stipitatus ATCC 10500]